LIHHIAQFAARGVTFTTGILDWKEFLMTIRFNAEERFDVAHFKTFKPIITVS